MNQFRVNIGGLCSMAEIGSVQEMTESSCVAVDRTCVEPQGSSAATPPLPPSPARFLSLDALRGFSMFWLLGGTQIVRALTTDAPAGSWAAIIREQFTHVEWDGFRFYDLIFPLFLFCIGVAVPISVERQLARGATKGQVLRHAFVRLAWMVFFGWWVNGNLLSWAPAKLSLSYSVLMMLGFGYLIAVCLVLFTRVRTQIWVTIGILVGYWVLQMGIPVPGHVPGKFVAGGIFSDWLYDQTIGQFDAPWKSRYGRGWPVTLWTHGASAMLGVFASYLLVRSGGGARAARWLLLGGLGLLALGALWSLHLPIVKNRWTSSYVLWCGGLSWLLLALFYWLIDLRGWRRWASLFLILGANSILAYLISTVFMGPFRSLATTLFGGLAQWVGTYWHGAVMAGVTYGFAWLLLTYLYRQRVFLRL